MKVKKELIKRVSSLWLYKRNKTDNMILETTRGNSNNINYILTVSYLLNKIQVNNVNKSPSSAFTQFNHLIRTFNSKFNRALRIWKIRSLKRNRGGLLFYIIISKGIERGSENDKKII